MAARTAQPRAAAAVARPSSARVAFHKLFAFADKADAALMALGTLGALANGAAMPLMTVLFGDLIDEFGGTKGIHDVVDRVSMASLASRHPRLLCPPHSPVPSDTASLAPRVELRCLVRFSCRCHSPLPTLIQIQGHRACLVGVLSSMPDKFTRLSGNHENNESYLPRQPDS